MAVPPPKSSLRIFAGDVLNQTNQDCVAHALAYAIRVCHAQRSLTTAEIPYVSRRFVYWNSRKYHDAIEMDGGTFIRTAIKSINKLGFAPESAWPYSRPWAKRPSVATYETAFDNSVEYMRIDGSGSERLLAVRSAIAAGFPVVMGLRIDSNFERAQSGDMMDPPDENRVIGGHAVAILEYDEMGFYGPNSWGTDHGTDGWFSASSAYVGSEMMASDFWAIQSAAPTVRGSRG